MINYVLFKTSYTSPLFNFGFPPLHVGTPQATGTSICYNESGQFYAHLILVPRAGQKWVVVDQKAMLTPVDLVWWLLVPDGMVNHGGQWGCSTETIHILSVWTMDDRLLEF